MTNGRSQETKPPVQIVTPEAATSKWEAQSPTLWFFYSFAPDWFEDALTEASRGQDHHARRREIIFAVCAVESYLVEWVRDEVLKRQFASLTSYFPSGDRRGITQRWKEVLK